MDARARVDEGWVIHRIGKGWTRRTGILRAHLVGVTLAAWTHPDDAEILARLAEHAHHGPASAIVRLGPPLEWRPVRLLLGRWRDGRAPLSARAVPLPESGWWKLSEDPALPPVPHALYVVA